MQKHVNLVDLVKSFPTNIYLQNLASIQKRTSPVKFAHLAEKSESAVRCRIFQPRGAPLKAGAGARTSRTRPQRSRSAGWGRPTSELKGSIGEGPNHSNHSNHSNSFKIGIFRNCSLENSKISENFNIF